MSRHENAWLRRIGVLAEPGDARFASIPEPANSRAEHASLAASLTGLPCVSVEGRVDR
jgi:hypothetical protein